jgi:hypothetical protein
VVDSFPTSLNPRHKSQLIYSPEDDQNFKIIVPVHAIAYQTRILRIAKAALSEFCRKNKMVFEAVRKQLVENLGAQKRERAPIASGTPYQASKQDCIDIPLDADPELEQFLDVIPPEKLTAYLKLQHRPTKP